MIDENRGEFDLIIERRLRRLFDGKVCDICGEPEEDLIILELEEENYKICDSCLILYLKFSQASRDARAMEVSL